MKIYLGIVGSKKVQTFAKKYNCGWCLTPDNYRKVPHGTYFLDNGAFSSWKNKKPWNDVSFKVLINKYPDFDFCVCPDIVCGGNKSLEFSYFYLKDMPHPVYLAVQDGMNFVDVRMFLQQGFDGLFIGGSISWKFQTARMWADLAHLEGKKCHAGRVGTWEGFVHMHFCGVDSVDTTTASRHQDDRHIVKYLDYIKNQRMLGAAR